MAINLMSKREKLIYVRQLLNITQKELAKDNISREFISMVESGKRSMRRDMALTAMKNALEYAKERGIELDLDVEFIARSEEEDLCKICDDLSNSTDNLEKCHEIIEYGEEKDLKMAKVYALKKFGDIFCVNGEYEKASNKYLDALQITETLGRREINQKIYNNLGVVKNKLGEYADAVNYEKEALTFCNINNDEKIKVTVLYNLASNCFMLNKFDLSKKYLDEFFKLKLNHHFYCKGRSLYGYMYVQLKEYDKALEIYKELLEEDLDKSILVEIYHNTALCHQEKKEFEEAEKYFDIALELSKNNLTDYYKVQGAKGSMYFDKGMYSEAEEYLWNSMKLSEKFEDFHYSIDVAKVLYEVYHKKKDKNMKKEMALFILDLSRKKSMKEDILCSIDKLLEIAIEDDNLDLVREIHQKIKSSLENI